MRKFFIFLLTFLLVCTNVSSVLAEGIIIEQVISARPNINVYGDFDFENLSAITASATIGEEKLTYTGARSLDSSDGVMYMFLVDCSTSISHAQMSAIKTALKEFVDTAKKPSDRVCILSFGLETEVLCDGNASDAEVLSAIDRLKNNQDGTVLFDAIDKAVELSNVADDSLPYRKVAVIFSDADDFNVGGHTVEETINLASTSSLPFYSIGLNTGSKKGLDTFGQISRASGAKIVVASASDIQTCLVDVIEDIQDCDVITFATDRNVISGKQQLFNLSVFSDGKTYTASRTISDLRWSEDNEAPYVTTYEQLAPNIIRLTFSEDVLYADNTASYAVRKGKNTVPLLSASYEKSTHSATLTFASTPVSGEYKIQFFAITDNSMENNAISPDSYLVKIKGRNVILVALGTIFTKFWWILLVIAIITFCLIGYHILKKRNGLVFVNGKFSFGDKVKVKVKPDVPKDQHKILLDVKDALGIVTQLDLSVTSSMIFGRSRMCDFSFEDEKLSRQHFAIEATDGCFTITNLSETNGTLVNGIRMNQRRKLQEGDKIFAGQTEITVRKLRW